MGAFAFGVLDEVVSGLFSPSGLAGVPSAAPASVDVFCLLPSSFSGEASSPPSAGTSPEVEGVSVGASDFASPFPPPALSFVVESSLLEDPFFLSSAVVVAPATSPSDLLFSSPISN